MRSPRRLLLITAIGLTAAVGLSGCGVAADDTAATVGGVTISATLVNQLATDDAFMAAMTNQALQDQRTGVVEGPAARQVLAFLVSSEVLAQEVARWDATVSEQDMAQGEATISQQAPELKGRARDSVLRYLVDRAALQARLGEIDPSSDKDMRRLYEGVPAYWDQVCMTAVVVPAGGVADARAALRKGADLAELEEAVQGSRLALTTERCVPRQYLPEALRTPVASARVGALVGPVPGVFPGDDAVVWFRVESAKVVPYSDAGDALAELVRLIAQQGVESWLNLKANALVDIDPRYGSQVEVGQQGLTVLAPATPVGTP
ncbi:MAG: hypothetical protein EKK62_02940 [Acidimicrobiia bacterium]|nr:peptidylprolyl isomerase [Microthrixaceae bacterium]RTL09304.1 MAG: hypothetical protein EKK62_02940 [Acidimicrobiia bacterium]HMU80541.1 peptidylprolyl isomerase [Microthrixaceae bacterium]